MPLRIESRQIDDVLVVQCFGRIAAAEASKTFPAYFADKRSDNMKVVLQLDEVTFVDSSGLGALVRLAHGIRARGGDVKLCGVGPTLVRVLELTNLRSLFEIYESPEEATFRVG